MTIDDDENFVRWKDTAVQTRVGIGNEIEKMSTRVRMHLNKQKINRIE